MPPRVLWQQAHARSMPATGADAVVLHAGTLYFIVEEDGGRIAAVDADTGRRKWTSSIDSSGYMSADHSAVYTVARPEPNRVELIALSADSGRPLWRYAVSAERSALSRPVSAGDRVYWAHDGVLHAVESTWGKPVWQLPVDPGQPVVVAREGKGHLIVASPVLLARLQAEDGQRVYERRLGRESAWAARPIICSDHDRLFLARNAGPSAEILCCRISDGEPLWTRRVSRPVAMTAADGMLHVRGRRVRTLDAATGEQLWSYDAAGCGPVSRVGDRVVLADNSRRGELVALDCRSGEIAWRQGGIQSCDQLISANDVGYIKTRDGVLRAMTLPQKM
jgi:outer membrane protein assembly factor BamB